MRKLISYLLIILTWILFGYIYFSLFQANRPLQEGNTNEAQTGGQSGRIEAVLAQEGRDIQPDMLCLNTSALDDPPWTDAKLQQAIQELNIRTLRIPGNVAGFWDWKTGQIAPGGGRDEPLNKDNNLERYLEGLKATETQPILVLNMLTSNLADQLKLLEAVDKSGIPVRYVELGHGFYQGGLESAFGQVFPDGSDYAAVAEEWATAVRGAFPEANLAIVAAPPGNNGRLQGWNEAVFQVAAAQNLAVAFYPFPARGLEAGRPFTERDIADVLGLPFQAWHNYSGTESSPLTNLPGDVPVWLTAYNLSEGAEGEPQVSQKWAQTLFVMTQSLLFLEDERVVFICPQQLTGPRQWAAYLQHGRRFDLMPTGRAVRILGRAMTGMTQAYQLEFTNIPAPQGSVRFDYPTLIGWTFQDDNGRQTAIILNLDNDRLEINIEDLPAGFPQQYQQRLGDPVRLARNNQGSEVLDGNINDKNFLVVLPYSATLFFSEE